MSNIAQLVGMAATVYGVIAALAVLLQARQMLAHRASCEVSARFFASYSGGYGIWLFYGLSVRSMPLIVVDVVGLVCGGLTLAVVLSLRGSLIHPTTWTSCGQLSPWSPRERGLTIDIDRSVTALACGPRDRSSARDREDEQLRSRLPASGAT
jgi:uncharacterized protein with PQ loop repeat